MSSLILADGQLASDDWTVLDDEAAWPESGHVVVSLARWRQGVGKAPAGLEVAVSIPNTENVDEFATELLDRPMLLLEIPKFADGRAYSQARVLRDRYRYTGQIRAVGEAHVDQIHFMRRCGFDAFVLPESQSVDAARRKLDEFSLSYEHAADPLTTVWERRRAARAPG